METATQDALTLDPATHIYKWQGKPVYGVTSIFKAHGMIYPGSPDDLARGRIVHTACHYLDEDDLAWEPGLDPYKGYIEAWKAFRSRMGLTLESFLDIETPRYSELYAFAGTLDRRVLIMGYEWIIDIKTGKAPKWGGLQTAAYDLLLPTPAANGLRRRACVELRADGTYNFVEHENYSDAEEFLTLLSAHRILRRHNARNYRD